MGVIHLQKVQIYIYIYIYIACVDLQEGFLSVNHTISTPCLYFCPKICCVKFIKVGTFSRNKYFMTLK